MNRAKLGLAAIGLLLSCSQGDPTPGNKSGTGIIGRWRLFEIQGSTGASSFTTPISAKPLQALTFTSGGQLRKEGNQLGDYYDYPFYRVDSSKTGYQVRFLTSQKDTLGVQVGLTISKDTLRLTPFCAEGCRQSFVRIN